MRHLLASLVCFSLFFPLIGIKSAYADPKPAIDFGEGRHDEEEKEWLGGGKLQIPPNDNPNLQEIGLGAVLTGSGRVVLFASQRCLASTACKKRLFEYAKRDYTVVFPSDDPSREKPYAGETPDDVPEDFQPVRGGGKKKKSDQSHWEPDYSQHAGSTWKRWKNKKTREKKGSKPESVRPDGSVR